MKALVRILAGRNFSLSFSVFEASLIVGVSKISRDSIDFSSARVTDA